MMLAKKLLSGIGDEEKLFVDAVFSAYTYTGNSATRTINNGIDLAGKGGLVWYKQRNGTFGHQLYDTFRGATEALESNSTAANATYANGLTAFNDAGYTLGLEAGGNSNLNTFVSWTFRRSPKFFDVVTYTGNGGTNVISHALGSVPGMIIVKRTNAVSEWIVQHRSVAECGFLNLTNGFASAQRFSSVTDTAITTTVSTADTNASGGTYVAYLFAHDPSADGIIQCGSFTTDGGGNATVNLGWEPQYVLSKRTTTASNWQIVDSARGFTVTSVDPILEPNTSRAEQQDNWATVTSTGFEGPFSSASQTYIYLAIRRPNKPPTVGTQVYNAVLQNGTATNPRVLNGVGFAPDFLILSDRNTTGAKGITYDRLRGPNASGATYSTSTETAFFGGADGVSLNMDGVSIANTATALNGSGVPFVHWFFKRAPGFFDVVCYTGTGAGMTITHGLGAIPELMIVKSRSTVAGWPVRHSSFFGTSDTCLLNATNARGGSGLFGSGSPTASTFTLGNDSWTTSNSITYVAYLFATLPGISKVGSYTGNGTSQTIDCGFTTGARFILIKRTDSTGDWKVFDSTRGIVSANDPHLALNTTAAEVTTDDSVDPAASGFIINQVAATNLNVNGGQYIFLAIA